ncbi:hypothetical protein Hanom_Chr14g01296721 [Helianthus anomalus]
MICHFLETHVSRKNGASQNPMKKTENWIPDLCGWNTGNPRTISYGGPKSRQLCGGDTLR